MSLTRIAHYRVLELVGRGGMGEVHTAHDEKLDRVVALKTVSADRVGDSQSRARLVAEARARMSDPICTRSASSCT